MEPLVSFVVPCYRLAHLLPECVNSILKQTFGDFEILIMDNCSPDNTAEVAQSFRDSRVHYTRNEINIGHLANFNKGIMASKGRYVWLISPDDYLRTGDVLERFVAVMEQHPSVGYVFCRALEVQKDKEPHIVEWADCGSTDRIWPGWTFLARLAKSDCVVFSSVMVRRECYERVTVFPLDLPHAADWYLWCVLALHYQVGYLADPMVCYRVHGESQAVAFRQQDPGIFFRDEVAVLWRVGQMAEAAGARSVRRRCRQSIVGYGARALYRERQAGAERTSACDFELILQRFARGPKEANDVRARVWTALGDLQYWAGSWGPAKESYDLGIALRPWSPKIWAKYILLHMGPFGALARRTAVAARAQWTSGHAGTSDI